MIAGEPSGRRNDGDDDADSADYDRDRYRHFCTVCGRSLTEKERHLRLETCLVCSDE